jgi:peroxiredoxin family protein
MKTYKQFITEATIELEDFVAGGLIVMALFKSITKGFKQFKSNMNKKRLEKIIASDKSSYKYISTVNKIDKAVSVGKEVSQFFTPKGMKEFGFSGGTSDIKAMKKLEKKVMSIIRDVLRAYKKDHHDSNHMSKEGVEFILNNIDKELKKTKYFRVKEA